MSEIQTEMSQVVIKINDIEAELAQLRTKLAAVEANMEDIEAKKPKSQDDQETWKRLHSNRASHLKQLDVIQQQFNGYQQQLLKLMDLRRELLAEQRQLTNTSLSSNTSICFTFTTCDMFFT